MASGEYSFIDIAVLDEVRGRFAAGDALAILSCDLEEVIWANGPGAKLFGYPDIEAIMGASAGLDFAQRRQIAATSGFPDVGRDRPVLIRISTGVRSQAVMFLASGLTLPDGEKAILLAAPAPAGLVGNPEDKGARAISGFTEAGYYAVFISDGKLVATTPGFDGLGISPETIAGLVAEAAGSRDRLVKRLIPARDGQVPAGMARLADEPPAHLLVVVDDPVLYRAEDFPALPAATPGEPASLPQDETTSAGTEDRSPEPGSNSDTLGIAADEASPAAIPANDHDPEQPGQFDRWYFEADALPAEPQSGGDDAETPVAEEGETIGEAPTAVHLPPPPRDAAPVRFAWRTDAAGHFRSVSTELLDALRISADSIVGRSFAEIASDLRMDPDGEIAALLERRDTWSGRTVHWPLAGTDLRVPVDLAALPVYARDRRFEGFKGFGIARLADALADPDPPQRHSGDDAAADATGNAAPDEPGLREQKAPVGDEGEAAFDTAAPTVPASDEKPPIERSAGGSAPSRTDPFRGETPVIAIEEARSRRYSDKIIRLAEHRSPASDRTLSAGERSAFREIGDRLKDVAHIQDRKPQQTEPTAQPPADEADGSMGSIPTTDIGERSAILLDEPSIHEEQDAPEEIVSGEDQEQVAAIAEDDVAYIEVEEELLDLPLPAEQDEPAATTEQPPVDEAEASTSSIPPTDLGERNAVLPDEPSVHEGPQAPGEIGSGEDQDPGAAIAEDGADYIEVEEELLDLPLPSEQTELTVVAEEAGAADLSQDVPDEETIVDLDTGERQPARAAGEIFAGEAFMDRGATDDLHTLEGKPEDKPEGASAEPAEDQVKTGDEAAPSLADEGNETISAGSVTDLDGGRGFVPSAFAGGEQPANGVEEAILNSLPLPLLVHCGDVLHHGNAAFFALTGYESLDDLEEHGGLGALFVDPYSDEVDDLPQNRGAVLRSRDGRTFPVRAHLHSTPWRGRKALLLALSLDVEPETVATDKEAGGSASLLEARVEEMRTILDTATDGVVRITPDGMIRSINRPAEALFGYEDREMAGKPFTGLFAVESQRSAREYLESLSENGVASVLNDGREVIGREAQGRFIPLFMTIGRLPGGNGFCAVLRDITQWKRAEEELTQARALAERSSSQKSEFLARVSHEIRTPLNAIIGFSELMVDEKFGPIGNDRYRDYLRDINRSGNHVLDLVNDLLDISKIEAGEQEMDYEAVSLNDVLAETVAMMQPQANRERVIIRSSFSSQLPEIVADLRSIRQIGLNLLSNAVRFTHPGGQVIVSTAYEASGDVIMRVRDTGVGMSSAEIDQALKPFKQINSLKRRRMDGTGLGLPLTKAMVEANRARFAISSNPGEGTLVEVTFPSTRVLAD